MSIAPSKTTVPVNDVSVNDVIEFEMNGEVYQHKITVIREGLYIRTIYPKVGVLTIELALQRDQAVTLLTHQH